MTTLRDRFAAELVRPWVAHAERLECALELTPEQDTALRAEATEARVLALADTLARDAEAVCAALVPEEDRAAVLAALEVDRWPIVVNPRGEHGWYARHVGFARQPLQAPGAPPAVWYIVPVAVKERLAKAGGVAADNLATDALVTLDGDTWPPRGWTDKGLSWDTIPREETRPWLSVAGGVLVTDALWRVRAELGARWTWDLLAGGDSPKPEHEAAATLALGDDASAAPSLAAGVRAACVDLARRLDEGPAADAPGDLLWADDVAARYLESQDAGDLAGDLRAAARGRWTARWETDAPALWRLWRPKVNEEPVRRLLLAVRGEEPDYNGAPRLVLALAQGLRLRLGKPAAVVVSVAEHVGLLHRPGNQLRLALPHAAVLANDGREVARFDLPTTPEDTARTLMAGTKMLGSLQGHELVRWELLRLHEAHTWGTPHPQTLTIHGGWTRLAREVRGTPSPSTKDVAAFRYLVRTQATVPLKWPDGGEGPMVLLREFDDPQDGRRSFLELTFPPPLLPRYEQKFQPGSPHRLLVPIVPMPPLVGPKGHAQQAALQWAFMVELRARAAEYLEAGGVEIDAGRWARLADGAGFPVRTRRREHLGEVLAAWRKGTDRTPPFLAHANGRLFTLADDGPFRPAHLFLLESGRRTVGGRQGGRKSARTRSLNPAAGRTPRSRPGRRRKIGR